MHDCRLGYPGIALWIADQHEGRPEHITASTPRLTAEEQEERRSIDAQRTKELDPADVLQAHESRLKEADQKLADVGGWVPWDGKSAQPPVSPTTWIQVKFMNGEISLPGRDGGPDDDGLGWYGWDHARYDSINNPGYRIIAYRLVPQ